ncbi:hypothetical protein N0V84_012596 [Fusarium piperis]|uniref:MFS transporter n=1 Tax=Fusarium piperis TaxID=1435070 RepID=A0A9W8W3M3_9HYPO|nr:hypothetical protein N0V84_012596 [Fusarium piperis]
MSLYQLPLNRLIERRLCGDFYRSTDPSLIQPDGSIDEKLCKVDEIEKSLGRIQGVMETLWVSGDFIMTIPLSFLAETWGRRAILGLNLVPRVLMLLWARAIYFGYMSSVSYVVALLGPALASSTMTLSLWLPFWLGIFLLLLAIPAIYLLPSHGDPAEGRQSPDEEQREPLLSSPLLKAQDDRKSLFHSTADRLQTIYTIVTSHPRNFTLLLISFMLTSLASSDTKLLVQYISGRYHWTFAAAGYLLSGKAVVNFTLLTWIIPKFLHSRAEPGQETHSTVDKANVRYASVCLIVSVLGALGIAVAAEIWMLIPSLFVYALGSALPIFTLSLLKSPAICPPYAGDATDPSNPESHIFSIVMLVKTVGSLLGAPLMAALWVRGIGIGGVAFGMPYFVSATCYMIAIYVFRGINVE